MMVDVHITKLYEYDKGEFVSVETDKGEADLTEYRNTPEMIKSYFFGRSALAFEVEPDLTKVFYEVPTLDFVTGFTRYKVVRHGA